MSQFDTKMTELADKIKSKNTAVTGKLSVQGMIDAVGNISTGVELPEGIDVTPADVKDNVFYIDGKGNKVEGEMPVHKTVNVTLTDSEQTLDRGYYDSIVIPAMPSGGTGDSTVKFGYWTEEGKFQEVDLSGDSPVDSGEPVAVNAVMFDTGKDVPDYGGGSAIEFYMATSMQGAVEKITLSGLYITNDMDEKVSLNGEYILQNPGAFGTDRIWYCANTTAGTYNDTEYASTASVCIGCLDYEFGYDDATGEPIYEKMWSICTGKTPGMWSAYYYCEDTTIKSPMQATSWLAGELYFTPDFAEITLTPSTNDVEPYGPTAWNGKKMTWQEREIYLTYGNDCLAACVGYWVRQDSGEITLESSWVNPISGAVLRVKDRSNEYRTWCIYWTLDYYKGEMGVVYNQGGDNWIETGSIPNPFTSPYTSALYNVMPQGNLNTAYGTEGWYPSETETTGLEIKKSPPVIGQIYNEDATVKIGAMYPAE